MDGDRLQLLATHYLWIAPSGDLVRAEKTTKALPRPQVKIEDLWDKHRADAVKRILDAGASSVWIDAKLSGIPSMVEDRVHEILGSGAHYVSVMAASGINTMMVAHGAADRQGCQIVAVTVPTSIDRFQVELDYGRSPEAQVLHFAQQAYLAGVRIVVCSPKEIAILKAHLELEGMKVWATGIREEWESPGDQKRTGTVREAILAGADKIVVGRRFTESRDQADTFRQITFSVSNALRDRDKK